MVAESFRFSFFKKNKNFYSPALKLNLRQLVCS